MAGLEELLGGMRYWRISHLIGVRDLRHRYVRSKLGQLWLTLSTAMMIGALGGYLVAAVESADLRTDAVYRYVASSYGITCRKCS